MAQGWYDECDSLLRSNTEFLKEHQEITQVFIVFAWSSIAQSLVQSRGDPGNYQVGLDLMEQELERRLGEMASPGRKFAIIAEVPKMEADPIACFMSQQTPLLRRRCKVDLTKLDREYLDRAQWPARERLLQFASKNHIPIAFPDERLCDDKSCLTWINHEFIYRDSGHLRRNLSPETFKVLGSAMRIPDLLNDPDSLVPSVRTGVTSRASRSVNEGTSGQTTPLR
jgi:hypothetical protein